MANKIQTSNLQSTNFVSSLSRYLDSDIIYYGDNNLITFTTYKKKKNLTTSDDKFAVITPGMEYRPDKVSYAAYGTVDFWWRIMEANDIKDIFDFKAGVNIRLPGNIFS